MLSSFHAIPNRRRLAGVGLVGTFWLLSACSTAPSAPPASFGHAKHAIEMAEQESANQHAPAELDEARQRLESADKAFAADDPILADRLAQQSTVMAELATARTEARKATEINQELIRGSEALAEEMQRAGDNP